MKSNALLKFIVPAVILAIVIILIAFKSPKKPTQGEQHFELSLSKEEAKELGIEGDTPQDTLRTLVGELKSMRTQINASNERNTTLANDNKRFEERERALEARINQAVQAASEDARKAKTEALQLNEQAMQMFAELQEKVSGSGISQLPIGLGLEAGLSDGLEPTESVVWVEPSDAVQVIKGKPATSFTFPNSFANPLDGSILDKSHQDLKAAYKGERNLGKQPRRQDEQKPMYTIAENSTLMGSTTMTALIGRVPIDGSVNDPYPFKVLIGKDNLAANGIELPEVTGAVMAGTATGDWTLSCVRGQVESITFVFEDGTIRTVPEPEKVTRGRGSTTSSNIDKIRGGIGYLSDPYGIPCLAGDRKSNAKEYIGNNALITAAGAAIARTFANDGGSTQYSSAGSTTITDNNQAFNSILTRGVGDIQDWVNKLYGQAFAAVYVPPHQQVAVHIDRELTIDFETFGRKVKHNEASIEIYELD